MRTSVIASLLLLAACGSGDAGAVDSGTTDDAVILDAGVEPCPRAAAPEDAARRVLVSHPYDADGARASLYRLLELTVDGSLSDSGMTFEMGRAFAGEIAFTPDGLVAVVPQEDGTLGVVAFDGDQPRVVHAAFAGDFYAGSVTIDPRGDRLVVIDSQWRENGGGTYELAIGCDGQLGPARQILPAKLPVAVLPVPGTENTIVVAHDVLDTTGAHDAHLLSEAAGAAPAVLGSVDAFPDDDALVSSAALTHDGRYLLIADNSEFSGVATRVAVVEIFEDGLVPRQVLSPIEDPFQVVTSPYGGAALVVSGYGDALFALDYVPGGEEPFAVRGELSYLEPGPMLPGEAVMVERGALLGLVLIVEVGGVRRVRFGEAGAVDDVGVTAFGGDGVDALIGAIGVAP